MIAGPDGSTRSAIMSSAQAPLRRAIHLICTAPSGARLALLWLVLSAIAAAVPPLQLAGLGGVRLALRFAAAMLPADHAPIFLPIGPSPPLAPCSLPPYPLARRYPSTILPAPGPLLPSVPSADWLRCGRGAMAGS